MRLYQVLMLLIMCWILTAGISVADEIRIPQQNGGTLVIPRSSVPNAGDAGNTAHTNVQI
jgi:hypothetical protein